MTSSSINVTQYHIHTISMHNRCVIHTCYTINSVGVHNVFYRCVVHYNIRHCEALVHVYRQLRVE